MPSRPRLKDRLFTVLTTLAAAAIFVAGLSRGNTRVAIIGALFFLGYGLLHAVSRRLEPAARLVTGSEADQHERLAQFKATQLAGQGALAIAAIGVVLEFAVHWEPGLYVAGTALLVLGFFVAGLWIFGKAAATKRS